MNNIQRGELGRKAVHYTATLIPLIYFGFFGRLSAGIILGLLTAAIVTAEVLRMKVPACRRLYENIFGWMIRPHEFEENFTGATYVFLGSFVTVLLFPKPIAITSLLFLTLGDPTACLVGMSVGRTHISNKKTLEGAIAFLIIAIVGTLWVPGLPWRVKVAGALAACLVEVVHRKIDDNLLIPLVSATVMYMLVH